MKILITGSKGFIGKKLILVLNNLDIHEVHGIDDEYFSDLNLWEDNLRDSLNSIKPDFVFHVGADANTLEKRVNHIMLRNYESTKILTTWCKENSVPIVYSSSAANYGTNGRTPSNLYGWSKYVTEDYVVHNQGIGLRYFNVYGPGEEHKGNMASFLFQSFVKKTEGQDILLFPGDPKRDFVHVDDVVAANIYAMKNYENLEKKFYEVGTGITHSFEYLMDCMEFNYIYTDQKVVPKGYQYHTCSQKDKWLPEWRPKVVLKEGIEEYKNHLNNFMRKDI
tara:strand:+ start:12906 stop:13742 length:837 start_codon:yes stop_codon:yes gene_type:complete